MEDHNAKTISHSLHRIRQLEAAFNYVHFDTSFFGIEAVIHGIQKVTDLKVAVKSIHVMS